MLDYEPVSLASVCNAGVEVLGDAPGDVALGAVTFRGLPFLVGSDPPAKETCFVVPQYGPVSVEIINSARCVLVAHRLLAPTGAAGGGAGTAVAEYAFHFGDGSTSRVAIRERFEIQVVPTAWGQSPYLAVSDTFDGNLPRFEGPWGLAGARLTEHTSGDASSYYLWHWENPKPNESIEHLELIPLGGSSVLVAAVTLGHLDEHPFVQGPARPVRLVVTDPEAAQRSGTLDLEVDRGVATYPHRLPTEECDVRPGWGAWDSRPHSSPAYAAIAAVPSATLTVRHDGNELGRVRWGDVERDGHAAGDCVRVELADPGRNWVQVTVLDDATGQPVPCRVHFQSSEGVPYQPHGHHNHVAQNLGSWHYDVGGDLRLRQITYAYIDGTCQGWLPRGDVIVDVARGFEYAPLRETVRIEPGQRELTLRLRRIADMAASGWWSGDSHVHFLSTPGAHLEQLGEDLRVVNLLQSQWGVLFTNTEDFTGRPSVVDGGGYLTYVGQENRQHTLGHLILWGLKEPVMPWCSDGPDEAELGGALDATLSDWADRAHAQGATVVVPHFPNPNGEPAVLIATGRADAVEMLAYSEEALAEYYTYLNAGYRLPIVGGTDKMSSSVPVGLYRTYARLPAGEELTYDAWCAAVRAGRTFMSGGPLLSLSVDGMEPGDTLESDGATTVIVDATVESIFPLRSLEIVHNGEVVATAATPEAGRLALREEVRVAGHGWIASRAFGTEAHLDEWGRQVFAHTSPVYVAVGGPWTLANADGLAYIQTLVQGALDYVRHTAIRRADELTTHHHGEPDHLTWLERPFLEALEAIDARR
jgi:hypothetical protein